ncbi:retrovirus-related Pol polyprotein from transposon 412 [Trichonephila clavipes]|uniref:Retrovirus-related Pol polyprotein from transposon 412 n=1 Tax=Trichonephila clavipes TaxID=2585209 RepID=A0A8X6SJZ9_TRICX|nr:retrovirus-related Pol polyprotein from transposon 412 [Trichonephila clavipes]
MMWKFDTEKNQPMEMQTPFREDPVPRAANTAPESKRNLAPTGVHLGVMKTLHKVREHFYWNNVQSDVEKWCRISDPCTARKGPRKRTRGRLQLYNMGAPFKRIAFDILGPLPRSQDGNNNILVVVAAMGCLVAWLSWTTSLSGQKPILFPTKRPRLLQRF